MRALPARTLAIVAALGGTAAVLALAAVDAKKPAVYVDRVVGYTVGEGGGYGEKKLPDIVLGPPHGGGKFMGGSDVFSLGKGGHITLEFVDNEVVDEPGPDFIIFENAFLEKPGDDPTKGNFELAKVEVSYDGREWHEFPYDVTTRQGCAGWPDDLRLCLLLESGGWIDPLRHHAISDVLRGELCVVPEVVEGRVFGVAVESGDLVDGGVCVVEAHWDLVEGG